MLLMTKRVNRISFSKVAYNIKIYATHITDFELVTTNFRQTMSKKTSKNIF
jgi:hypothetical protein